MSEVAGSSKGSGTRGRGQCANSGPNLNPNSHLLSSPLIHAAPLLSALFHIATFSYLFIPSLTWQVGIYAMAHLATLLMHLDSSLMHLASFLMQLPISLAS